MAVQSTVCGLRPMMQNIHGGLSRLKMYGKVAGDSNPIYMFDVVQTVTDASVPKPDGGNPVKAIAGGNLGTAGTGLWLGSSLNYGAASTATMHLVCDDPDAIFLAQSAKSTAATVAATSGLNANLVVSGGSNAQLGPIGNLQSGMTVSATTATTTGLDVRILDWFDSPANPDNAAYPIFEIEIVLHQLGGEARTAV